MLKINTTKYETKQETIKEQEKIRELDQFIFSIFLNENKKVDKKKAKKIYNDLNKFVCNNN
jgi:hypothetical protein